MSADWQSPNRSLFVGDAPSEPQPSPPPPRAGSRYRDTLSASLLSVNPSTPARTTPAHCAHYSTQTTVRHADDAGGAVHPAQATVSGLTVFTRSSIGGARPPVTPLYWPCEPTFQPSGKTLGGPVTGRHVINTQPRFASSLKYAGALQSKMSQPPPLPSLLCSEEPAITDSAPPDGRRATARRLHRRRRAATAGHPLMRPLNQQGLTVETAAAFPNPAPRPETGAEAEEERRIFRRIGYSLLTEALRLQGLGVSKWFPVKRVLDSHARPRESGACFLEYTYLTPPSAGKAGQPEPPSAQQPGDHRDVATSTAEGAEGDIPLYRATTRVPCTLETLNAALATPDSATRYLFNAELHRVVALCDNGRGCLQHTSFRTQPPTDVVCFHYMRLMAVDHEFSKAASSKLSTRLCEALRAYLETCPGVEEPEGRNPTGHASFSRPRGAPRRVFVCSSTSVEDPRVPLQWGYTRCRVHLSALVAYEVEGSGGGITLQHLYAQDSRDQRDGIPGPTGGDHSISAMLAQRTLLLKEHCLSLEQGNGNAAKGRCATEPRGVPLVAHPLRFVLALRQTPEHPNAVGSSTVTLSRPGSPRAVSYLPYYQNVWRHIRDLVQPSRTQPHEEQLSQKPHGHGRQPWSEQKTRGTADSNDHHGGLPRFYPQPPPLVQVASPSPEPRHPLNSASPSPRPSGVHAGPNTTMPPQYVDPRHHRRVAKTGQGFMATADTPLCTTAASVGAPSGLVDSVCAVSVETSVSLDIDNVSEILNVPQPDDLSLQYPGTARTTEPAITPVAATPVASEELPCDRKPIFTRKAVEGRPRSMRTRSSGTRSSNVSPPPASRRGRHLRPATPAVGTVASRQKEEVATQQVRLQVLSCTGLPASPFRGGSAVDADTVFYVSLRSSLGGFHARTAATPYGETVTFRSPSSSASPPWDREAFTLPVPPLQSCALTLPIMTLTAVASRSSTDSPCAAAAAAAAVGTRSAAAPLIRLGEAEVLLGNLRAGTVMTLAVPLVSRPGTAFAKVRAWLQCTLTPVDERSRSEGKCRIGGGPVIGLPPSRLLTPGEENEVRGRFLSVLQSRCPSELHRLEVYVGMARALRLTEAFRRVEAFALPSAAGGGSADGQCFQRDDDEDYGPGGQIPVRSSARQLHVRQAAGMRNPIEGVFARRPVSKTVGADSSSSDDPYSTKSATNLHTTRTPPVEELQKAAAVQAQPVQPLDTEPEQSYPRPSTTLRHHGTVNLSTWGTGRGRERKYSRGPASRAVSAPVTAETRKAPSLLGQPLPTVTLTALSITALFGQSAFGETYPLLVAHPRMRLFVEVTPVGLDIGISAVIVEANSKCTPSIVSSRGQEMPRPLLTAGEELQVDLSSAFSGKRDSTQVGLSLSLWHGVPECRVALIGSCVVSIEMCSGANGVEAERASPWTNTASKELMLVSDAGRPSAKPCGQLTITYSTQQRTRRPRSNYLQQPQEKQEPVRGLPRQRLATLLWAHCREELHFLDVHVAEVARGGGLAPYARRRGWLPEPPFSACRIRCVRLHLPPSARGSGDGHQMTAVFACATAGWHIAVTEPVPLAQNDLAGGASLSWPSSSAFSMKGLVALRDELETSLFAVCSGGSGAVAPILREVGRVVVPLRVFAADGHRRQVVVPIVAGAGQRGATLAGLLVLEVEVEGRDFSTTQTFRGFDENWAVRKMAVTALSRFSSQHLHRLFCLLSSEDSKPTGGADTRALTAIAACCGVPPALVARMEEPLSVDVQVLGLRDVHVPDGSLLYAKGYYRERAFLRSDAVAVKSSVTQSGQRSLPCFIAASATGNGAEGKPWKHAQGILRGALDLHHDTFTIKIGRQRALANNEALAFTEVSLAELSVRGCRCQTIWVPFYREDGGRYLAYAGTLGLRLTLCIYGQAAATHSTQGTLQTHDDSQAPMHLYGRGSGTTDDRLDAPPVLREVACLLRHRLPAELLRLQPIAARVQGVVGGSRVYDQCGELSGVTALAALRDTLFSNLGADPVCTLHVLVGPLSLAVPSDALPSGLAPAGSTGRLLISAIINGKQLASCYCQVAPSSSCRAITEVSFMETREPCNGCLRLDIPASLIVSAAAAGHAPALELTLQHVTVVEAKATAATRQNSPATMSKRTNSAKSRRGRPRAQSVDPAGGRRTRSSSLAGMPRRSLSLFASSGRNGTRCSGASERLLWTGLGTATTTVSPPAAFRTASKVASIGELGTFPDVFTSPPVDIAHATLSLRGLLSSLNEDEPSPVDIPLVGSMNALRSCVGVPEFRSVREVVTQAPGSWPSTSDADTLFRLGDLPVRVVMTPEEQHLLPSWLQWSSRRRRDVILTRFDAACALVAKRGDAVMLRSLHFDTFENCPVPSDRSTDSVAELVQDTTEVTPLSQSTRSTSVESIIENCDRETVPDVPCGPPVAAKDAADARRAQQEQQTWVAAARGPGKQSTPAQSHSISFWTAEHDGAMSLSPSDVSSIVIDPEAEQDSIRPTTTNRALF